MPKTKIRAAILVGFLLVGFTMVAQITLPTNITTRLHLTSVDSFYVANSTVIVQDGAELVIDKNVEVRFASQIQLYVYGSLQINGDSENRVRFTAVDTTKFWGYINASHAEVVINGLEVIFANRFINASYGRIILKNCMVDKTYGGIGADCIGVHYADSLYISGCFLNGNPQKPRIDAIDCDAIDNGVITNNVIQNFEDDGIDVGTGTELLTLTNNRLNNCNFGISVGESSYVVADRNVITGCDAGMQSHTSSTIMATHNTLYNNTKGFELHHGSASNSAGTVIINSSIIAHTKNVLYSEQSKSLLMASYCLSDSLVIPGENNLVGAPAFTNVDVFDFTLTELSPCINAADPNLALDDFGNVADIGAFEFVSELNIQPSQYSDYKIAVYPNPATDYIVISAGWPVLWRYDIISITGESVLRGATNQAIVRENITHLTPGVYLIKVVSADRSKSQIRKLVIR